VPRLLYLKPGRNDQRPRRLIHSFLHSGGKGGTSSNTNNQRKYLELFAEGEVAPALLVDELLLLLVVGAPEDGCDGGGEDDALHGLRLRARLQHVVRRADLRLDRNLLQRTITFGRVQ
jgi:hypothetical protein